MWALSLALALPNDQLKRVIEDHTLPHEAIPRGVNETIDWRAKPRVGWGNSPNPDWKAFIAWGQVYLEKDHQPVANTRVQIRALQAYILSKQTGKWQRVQFTSDFNGAAYREDFANDENKPADIRPEKEGLSVRLVPGYNYHFFPKSRVPMDPKDIAGVVTAVQTRLILDDAAKADDRKNARYLMSVGADYWSSMDAAWDHFKTNGDAAIGRFRFVRNGWSWHFMSTLGEAELRRNPPPAPSLK